MKQFEFDKYFRKNPVLPPEGSSRPLGDFPCAVVIPACDEEHSLPETLASLDRAAGREQAAVIVVVNHPPQAETRIKDASFRTLEMLKKKRDDALYFIDLASEPREGGVGMARKAGMDAYAASLPPEQLSEKIIFSLDADTLVAPDYFRSVRSFFAENADCGALSLRFRHRRGETPEQEKAIRIYEKYLENYVERLRRAGSPYAFQTVGSAIAVRAECYLRCGGMRVRTGGEDFYFLQAAAKTAKVGTSAEILVYPSPRESARVPFGTGPAVRMIERGEPLPEIPDFAFDELKKVLDCKAADLPDALPECAKSFFDREKFPAAWANIRRNTPPDQLQKAFHCYFDGLKTLRLLHYFERAIDPENGDASWQR